jgi:hypothetical protein
MGADQFSVCSKGKTAAEAFSKAVEEARYEDGHGGYTGTIAEKNDFKMVTVPQGKDPMDYVDDCMEDDDHFCQDKWGPAGCVEVKPASKDQDQKIYCFFGWASS